MSCTDVKWGQTEKELTDSFYLCSFPVSSCCSLPDNVCIYHQRHRGARNKGGTFLKQTVLSQAVLHNSEKPHMLKAPPGWGFLGQLAAPKWSPITQSIYSRFIKANESAATRAGQTPPFSITLVTNRRPTAVFTAPHSRLATVFGKGSQDHFVWKQFLAQQKLTAKISFEGCWDPLTLWETNLGCWTASALMQTSTSGVYVWHWSYINLFWVIKFSDSC